MGKTSGFRQKEMGKLVRAMKEIVVTFPLTRELLEISGKRGSMKVESWQYIADFLIITQGTDKGKEMRDEDQWICIQFFMGTKRGTGKRRAKI